MTASDYPITFPYGATDPPYSAAHPHRGDDRPCPSGTPVVINGVTIGLTGATGLVTGPHLHLQEWNTSYADVRKPQNSFTGGTVSDTGTLSEFGNFVTIQTADGWHDTYCHLSQINVTKGQVIGDNMGVITTEAVVALSLGTQGTQPQSKDEYEQWVGKSDQQSWDDLITHYSAKGQAHQAALEAAAQPATALKPGIYKVN